MSTTEQCLDSYSIFLPSLLHLHAEVGERQYLIWLPPFQLTIFNVDITSSMSMHLLYCLFQLLNGLVSNPCSSSPFLLYFRLLAREQDFGHLCDVVRGFFGGLGLGSKHSESLSLLILLSIGGSGWSDFELLDRINRVSYTQRSIASLLMHTQHCRYIQLTINYTDFGNSESRQPGSPFKQPNFAYTSIHVVVAASIPT